MLHRLYVLIEPDTTNLIYFYLGLQFYTILYVNEESVCVCFSNNLFSSDDDCMQWENNK
jgi:hypothetical protein